MSDEANGQPTQSKAQHVLGTLARVPVPEGMHERIALRLEQHEHAQKPQRLRSFAASLWPAPLALAITVAVITCGLPWHRHSKRPVPPPPLAALPVAALPTAVLPFAASPLAVHRLTRLQPQGLVHPAMVVARRAGPARPSRFRQESLQPSERVSYPAPPAPLTEEEKVLLEVTALRSPSAMQATRALVHTERETPPGTRLPTLAMTVPGEHLPTMATVAPGTPLPNLHQATDTGDQP